MLEEKYNELMQHFCAAAETLYYISKPEGVPYGQGAMCVQCKTPTGDTMTITVEIEESEDNAE